LRIAANLLWKAGTADWLLRVPGDLSGMQEELAGKFFPLNGQVETANN